MAVEVDEESDKVATCLKRTMGPRAAAPSIAIYRILNFVWQFLVSPFLPLSDVVTDIITVVTWYHWCEEGKPGFDCYWWILGVVFILLPICIMFVGRAIDIYLEPDIFWKKDGALSLIQLLAPFIYPFWHIFLSIALYIAKRKNDKDQQGIWLRNVGLMRLADVLFESIPQATIQWFLILTHGDELYHGTGTLLGQKYDIYWVSITSAVISTIRYGQNSNFSVDI